MKSGIFVFLIAGALLMAATLLHPADAGAGVNVSVGINIPPPAYVLPAPPEVVLIPGTYAYYAPDAGVDILFYQGFWYRPYEGRWFRARSYNGPWGFVVSHRVPSVIMGLGPDYRNHVRPGQDHIPYGQLKKNWARWEKEKHWDKRDMHHAGRDLHGEGHARHKEESRGHHEGHRGRPDRY